MAIATFAASAAADEALQPPPPPAPQPLVVAETEAFVHIDGDASLSVRQIGGRFGKQLCTAPCDQTIAFAPGSIFLLEGTLRTLDPFKLEPQQRNTVSVEGDFGAYYFGLVSMSVGGGALGAGGLTYLLDAFSASLSDEEVAAEHTYLYGGLMAGGAALLAIGIPLMVLYNPGVRVRQTPISLVPGRSLTVQF